MVRKFTKSKGIFPTDTDEIEQKIMAMYAKGMSQRDIEDTLREIYGAEISQGLISKITDKILPEVNEWQNRPLQLSKVQNHFMRYLQIGGFPELALADNDMLAQQILREDVVDKVLKRDLPSIYNIRNSTELERIFLYLCNVSSEIVSIEAITKELNGVSRTTVENYIKYLESANLIYLSKSVEMAGKKALKSSPKIYIADAAIRNAVLMDESIMTDATEMGKIVETAVYKHIASFYYQFATSVGYFRGGKRNKEVDIVVDYPNIKKILIEVKYREGSPIKKDDAIVELCAEASAAIVVTKTADDFGIKELNADRSLLRIPAFAFLYLLGNAEKHGYRGSE